MSPEFITTKDESMTITMISRTIAQWFERLNLPSLISTFGLCTIIFWIGAFKFTPTESRQMVYVEHSPFIGLLGSLLSVVIFTVTSTFMLSIPGMVAMADGMWPTSPVGSFVLKDVTLLGASLFLAVHYGQRSTAEK
jgi:uncharacterized membrane protein YkgB